MYEISLVFIVHLNLYLVITFFAHSRIALPFEAVVGMRVILLRGIAEIPATSRSCYGRRCYLAIKMASYGNFTACLQP